MDALAAEIDFEVLRARGPERSIPALVAGERAPDQVPGTSTLGLTKTSGGGLRRPEAPFGWVRHSATFSKHEPGGKVCRTYSVRGGLSDALHRRAPAARDRPPGQAATERSVARAVRATRGG